MNTSIKYLVVAIVLGAAGQFQGGGVPDPIVPADGLQNIDGDIHVNSDLSGNGIVRIDAQSGNDSHVEFYEAGGSRFFILYDDGLNDLRWLRVDAGTQLVMGADRTTGDITLGNGLEGRVTVDANAFNPPSGASPPSTCTVGDMFWDTDETDDTVIATTNDNALLFCGATDTWSVRIDS